MGGRFSTEGRKQVEFRVGPGELVRGATWTRGSGAIATPVNDVDLYIPESLEIVQVVILTEGGTGSCVVDLWVDTYASFPPDVSNTIAGGSEPEISGGISFSDATLAGWDTALAAGDVLRFHLASCSTFTRVSIFVVLRKG